MTQKEYEDICESQRIHVNALLHTHRAPKMYLRVKKFDFSWYVPFNSHLLSCLCWEWCCHSHVSQCLCCGTLVFRVRVSSRSPPSTGLLGPLLRSVLNRNHDSVCLSLGHSLCLRPPGSAACSGTAAAQWGEEGLLRVSGLPAPPVQLPGDQSLRRPTCLLPASVSG